MQVKLTVLLWSPPPSSSSRHGVAQDAAKGEQVFKQCMTCHRIGPDARIWSDRC